MRKGQIFDPIFIAMAMFCLAVAVLVIYAIATEMGTQLTAGSFDPYNLWPNVLSAMRVFDYVIVAFYFSLWIIAIISAFYVRSHPIFFIVTFPVAILVLLMNVLFSNFFYYLVTQSTVMSTASASFPFLSWILQNLPVMSVILSGLIALFLYLPSAGGTVGVQ